MLQFLRYIFAIIFITLFLLSLLHFCYHGYYLLSL